MDDTAKYLIHADITADGVVERSDVVGAIFGQTEGLLGDELDLRDLQQSSKVGRIDVEVESEGGRSVGTLTIASRLDKVETAILAAGLETIDRVGPCEATLRVTDIEDVRQAKRRAVVDRAKELLATAFDEDLMSSAELIEEVRESVRVERVTDYEGLPAGPRVATSDAIIVVEGRADVLTLLRYGIKNAIAVEGTNVPDAVADLTAERTVTAFLDGDRGGDLILRELDQVGDVDYVAFAPEGRSVEDLDRHEVRSALREKVPFEMAAAEAPPEEGATDADGSGTSPDAEVIDPSPGDGGPPDADGAVTARDPDPDEGTPTNSDAGPAATDGSATPAPDAGGSERPPATLEGHAGDVADAGIARLLDDDLETIAEVEVDEVFDAIRDAGTVPATVVMGGTVTQRILDVAAQRGVGRIVARSEGEFTKQPADVRVLRLDDVGGGA